MKPDTEGGSESSHNDKDEGIGEEDMEEYVDENGMRVRRVVTKTVTTTATKTSSDDGEPKHLTLATLQKETGQAGVDKDENTEVREYVDENGRRVRRIVKTITTTRIASNNGPSSVTTETKEVKNGGHDPGKMLTNFGGSMPRPSEEHSKLDPEPKPRAVEEKEVSLKFGSKPPAATQESRVKLHIKGQPFQTHNINMSERRGHTTITTGSSASDNPTSNTVYQRSVITKTIGGGDGGTKIVEHSTKTSTHDGEHPIMVVKKEKSQINMPEWMVKQSSPETKGKTAEMSDINIHLKYSSDYNPKKKDLEPSVNENRIHPKVAKQDKPEISMLTLGDVVNEKEKGDEKKADKTEEKSEPPQAADEEDEDEDDDDDEDEDEEVDEFEEEIVVMEVRRKPRYHKALEIAQPEKKKAGIPIEDLLELPTMEVAQESAPDENLIDEKVEAQERQPIEYEAPDIEELFRDN